MNQKSQPPVSNFKFSITNANQKDQNNEINLCQSIHKLMNFTANSFEKMNDRFNQMDRRYDNLSKIVMNIKTEKEYHDARIDTQLNIRSKNLEQKVFQPRFQNARIEPNIQNLRVEPVPQIARVEKRVFSEKDYAIEDDEEDKDDDLNLDIEDEEKDDGLHFNLNFNKDKKDNTSLHCLDRYINAYADKLINYKLALYSVDLFKDKCDIDKLYYLKEFPSATQNIITKFNNLCLYDSNKLLNKKRYSIINAILD